MTTAWGLTKLGQGCVGMQMIGFNRARRNGGCPAHWGCESPIQDQAHRENILDDRGAAIHAGRAPTRGQLTLDGPVSRAMNVAMRRARMSQEQFLDWAPGREERLELDGFRPVASPVARSTTKRDALHQGFNLSRRTTACLRAACSRLSSCRLIVDEASSLGGSNIGLSLMETHRLTM